MIDVSSLGRCPTLHEVTRAYVLQVMDAHHWERSISATYLGMSVRNLRILIGKYRKEGFHIPDGVPGRRPGHQMKRAS